MKRKIAALVLTALFVLAGLSGCQQAATTAAATETTTAAAAFPVTVQDASGQDIVIASAPQAIVATNIWAAEMLFGLVDTGRIKGLSAWGDNPVLSATAEQAKSVATRVTTGEPESIVALKPDLVIIDTFSDPDGSLTKTLADTGARTSKLAGNGGITTHGRHHLLVKLTADLSRVDIHHGVHAGVLHPPERVLCLAHIRTAHLLHGLIQVAHTLIVALLPILQAGPALG